jgi:hypothetical protein
MLGQGLVAADPIGCGSLNRQTSGRLQQLPDVDVRA